MRRAGRGRRVGRLRRPGRYRRIDRAQGSADGNTSVDTNAETTIGPALGLAPCLPAGLSYAACSLLTNWLAPRERASTITLGAFGTATLPALPLVALHAGPPLGKALGVPAWVGLVLVLAGVLVVMCAELGARANEGMANRLR